MLNDWRTAPIDRISGRAHALCAHAVRLTLSPSEITAADIDALRESGCSDEAIHDLTQVAALFAYYNRIADGLGIEPEPE